MPIGSCKQYILLAIIMTALILGWSTSVFSVTFGEREKSLPDYSTHSPFTIQDESIHKELQQKLSELEIGKDVCTVGVVEERRYDIQSNICDSDKFTSIKSTLLKMAPSLNPDRLTAWAIEINGDGEKELLVGHIDMSKSPYAKYPNELGNAYLSLWLLVKKGNNYKDIYAGPFLRGTLQDVRPFGPIRNRKTVFIRHQDCYECEPWIYLTPVDFFVGTAGDFFRFSYSKDHKSFAPAIEYGLPGLGHSVDASVETRVPGYSEGGPHLMQFFNIDEGNDEWWVFTCDGMKCDYELFLNDLPSHLKAIWENAEKL